ncbi:ATP-binding protein [Mycolicibacterium aichiense]|uniref:ATP-binding protein n=1 Tax=Mycolicibacterium aichiense TaxID=1799 RepID=UPI003D67C41F
MRLHPFNPERQIGVVYRVDGSIADVSLSSAAQLPRSHYGEYLGRGEVGEFVVIDVHGMAIFGRILQVGVPSARVEALTRGDHRVPAEARVQLLSTLSLDGNTTRGIAKYPKLGDTVFAAGAEATMAVIGASPTDQLALNLGRLSVDDTVEVRVPLSRLFGRHLAIVGATGSGKSWTLGHLAEGVARLNGKMLLIDATGEFHTLGATAQHLAFGSTDGEPIGTKLVGIPHYMMRETDRNAFFNPSGGAQLPKLREAVRSLRLAKAITDDPFAADAHMQMVRPEGYIVKTGVQIALFRQALSAYVEEVEGLYSPFDIRQLPMQIQSECIFSTSNQNSNVFGGQNNNELGYVGTLLSRVNDILQIPEVMGVINPPQGTANVLEEITEWLNNKHSNVLRISLRNLTFTNHLREIVVNILGQSLLGWAREGRFREYPLVVAIDEAHQFFDVTVGDEFASTRLNAFDAVAKEGRKYGLTVCVATQRPGDLPAGVLSQVGMTIAHRLADRRDRQRVEQAAAELDHSATQLLPGLVPGEAVLMGIDFPVPVSVRVHAPVQPPSSQGPRYDQWGVVDPNSVST